MTTSGAWQRLDAIVARLYREQAAIFRAHAGDDKARADILTAAADRLERAVRLGEREKWHS